MGMHRSREIPLRQASDTLACPAGAAAYGRAIYLLLAALIVGTPLAFGSVHPWAYAVVEVVAFALVLVWVVRVLGIGRNQDGWQSFSQARARLLILPTGLFLVPLLQLVPMPPAAMRLVSPNTFSVYQESVPGWPDADPYATIIKHAGASNPDSAGVGEAGSGGAVPGAWRSLSLAPSLTRRALLQLSAYLAIFLLAAVYRPDAGERTRQPDEFARKLLFAILAAGLVVAALGVIGRFTWNGRVLWFLVPYDWGEAWPGAGLQARGPFVYYVHFANYLTLIFPLAIAATLFPASFVSRGSCRAFQLFSAVITLVLCLGILLSLSRAGWIGAGLGVALLFGCLLSVPAEKRPALLRLSGARVWMRVALGFAALVLVALLFVGSSPSAEIDARLNQTLKHETSLGIRLAVWQQSLRMVREFPVTGVGLGAWPELFPHYQTPPWNADWTFREAHNDYLQLLTETGVPGFFAFAFCFTGLGLVFWRARRELVCDQIPIFAALLAALAVMAFHEFFDFCLHTPANAVLFSVILGLAARLAVNREAALQWSPPRAPLYGVGAIAAALMVAAVWQDKAVYPYDLRHPGSAIEAARLLSAYPAHSSIHLSLVSLSKGNLSDRQRASELQAAIWLEPTNPLARDTYADYLFAHRDTEQALREVSYSVFASPSLATHSYLTRQLIPWLSDRAKTAIEDGLKRAVAMHYEGSLTALGQFWQALSHFTEEADLYEQAARFEPDPSLRVEELLEAGAAYRRAGDDRAAERALQQALNAVPADPRAYQRLAAIFGARKDVAAAKALIEHGISSSADPATLWLALADACGTAGDADQQRAALLKSLESDASSFEANLRLGIFYLDRGKLDRAVPLFRKAAEIRPGGGTALFYEGRAEEARYRFAAAEQAYKQALNIEPDNAQFRKQYENLRKRIADNTVPRSS